MTNKYYDDHYASMDKQPIEIMQEQMSHEMFLGFLKGNMIKYWHRAGKKQGEDYHKEMVKYDRYKEWYDKALKGEHIDPRI